MILYKQGTTLQYAASMASTWVWAPAIYVSAFTGYYYGLAGALAFTVPNILALILFGYVSSYAIQNLKHQGFTFNDILESKVNQSQIRIHTAVSLVILVCSCMVQIIGMHLLLSNWFEIPKIVSALLISVVSLLIVWKSGIKGSIISDTWKYFITVIAGIILLGSLLLDDYDISKIKIYDPIDNSYLIPFAITGTIGLLSAPYVDQTFWQRAFSANNRKMFDLSAILFAVIPITFCLIGMICATNGVQNGWQISSQFNGALGITLGIAVFCALLSTLDSNLCALQSFVVTRKWGNDRLFMILLLVVASLLFTFIDITIAQLWLVYGTIRTSLAVPTLLIIFNKFDKSRLLCATILSVLVSSLGYMTLSYLQIPNAWVCTVLGLVIPLLGYRK